MVFNSERFSKCPHIRKLKIVIWILLMIFFPPPWGHTLIKHDLLEILSPSEPILRAIIENMISPDYVLCYIPRAMAILSWKWKFWNLLVRRRRPLWSQWRPLCGFGNFEKKIKILEFFPKILKIWKILN